VSRLYTYKAIPGFKVFSQLSTVACFVSLI